ncbi:hypothetical protein TanjilG_14807 [Lupinus angustifolius]|uniref:Uncharacterized protein n=1 Tax=Lupinus angustifolius TaxID=3871 RepID=A0A1J7HFS9_LUPAN|nr:hypothetical protein TanjilG_14807 [Lupinus angustifolius]
MPSSTLTDSRVQNSSSKANSSDIWAQEGFLRFGCKNVVTTPNQSYDQCSVENQGATMR